MKLLKIIAANGLAMVLLITILFAITSVVLKTTTRHGESLTVPDITGMPVDDAIDILTQKNLKYIITDSLYFTDKPKNSILDQNPAPQSKVKEGRVVYLTLNSSTPPLVNMPNLVDVSLRQAQVLLQSAGLKQGTLSYKPDIAQNVVLEQSVNGKLAAAGSRIPKGSTIDLVLGDGLGSGDVALPNLSGMTLEEASNLLASSSLSLGSVVYLGPISDSASAKVTRQHPVFTEGVMVGSGQPIDLFLAQ